MSPPEFLRRILAFNFLLLAVSTSVTGETPVSFSDVEATSSAGPAKDLRLTIDGRNASPEGWSVGKNEDSRQAIIFTTAEPLNADLLELTLYFMSGRPHASFANFALSFTTDTLPSHEGNWEPVPLLNYSATTCELSRGPGNRLVAHETDAVVTGAIPDDIYRISTRLPGRSVTGFRIEVYPVTRARHPVGRKVMAWGTTGDFVLTEFRVEVLTTSTNVALGASVSASHPLYQTTNPIYETMDPPFRDMTPDALTDGWPSTLAHPGDDVTGQDFHFEIDLGQQRSIDHIGLRQRGDDHDPNRFGQMRVALFNEKPDDEVTPNWHTFHRPDGSYPEPGEVDILRETNGEGDFHGRFIRISSENPVPLSPQLAEVEVYETRTPELTSVIADDKALPTAAHLQIPPDIQRLGFQFDIPQTGRPKDQLYRWKIHGVNEGWRSSNTWLLEIPCPPPGDYELQVQAGHSDGIWDASSLQIPLEVKARFTQTPAFLWLIAGGTLAAGVLLTRHFARRKIHRLEAHSALQAERSRIAANMHDDVGARIAQLTVLHDVFALEHELPPAAKADLNSLSTSAREAMASLDEAVWTVNPRNDTLPALATFILQHADSYLQPLGITCRTHKAAKWPDVQLPAGTRHEVALAFKEALQNIVKHANASEVELSLDIESNQCLVRVSDNGRGLPDEPTNPGQDGLFNMHRRLRSIGGSCEWSPRKPSGTSVTIRFPIS